MSTQGPLHSVAVEHSSQPVTLRLSTEEIEKAQILARRDHRTRAAFIRVMFLRGLASYEKEIESVTI